MNLYQDVFFRGMDRLRGRHNVERLRFLRNSQYWSAEQLRLWQLDRLNALLADARDNSPFYAERLAGLELPLQNLRDLEVLPALTRADIQGNGERIRTRHLAPSRYVPNRTGGSSGEPIHYYWDKRGQDWNRGSVYRSAEWAGVFLGDRAVQMSGSRFDLTASQQRSAQFANWLLRHRTCPVAAPTREDFERYRDVLHDFRPASIWGYSSAVDVFAAYLEEVDPGAEYPFLRALITSSETLRPEQRQRIERVFGEGKVFDHYGSREVYIASECPQHEGYHVHAEVLVVEIVDAAGRACAPGERGRVLITDLSNRAFPFIRYEIGDLAIAAPPSPCACGVTLPRLQSVEGRISDLIVLADRVLTAPNFCTLFSAVEGITAFQVRQDSVDRMRVLIEPAEAFTPEVESYLRGAFDEMVAGQARVDFVVDEPIEVPSSGKRRFVISSVTSDTTR